MPKFCSNCATALDVDAKFCPSCRAPVAVSTVLVSQLQAGVKSAFEDSSSKVPVVVWAAVIEVFWAGLTFVSSAMAWYTGWAFVAGSQSSEGAGVWLVLSSIGHFTQLAFQATLVYGFLAGRSWAYWLYVWSIGPLVLISLLTRFTAPEVIAPTTAPASFALLTVIGFVLGLGLVALQIILVIKSKKTLLA